jgi:hypothetical protein
VLIDRENFHLHRPWIFLTALLAIAATVWYFLAAAQRADWPPGSSLVGLTFGIVGGLICLFEFLLWPRKKVRTWRIGRVQVWMRLHIWFGLLAVPLLVLHSGFRFHNELANVTIILFLIVIVSGIWGLVLQNWLPRVMLDEVPAETIASQIPRVVAQLAREAERLVVTTCGAEPGQDLTLVTDDEQTYLVVGAVRTAGRVQGKVLETRTTLPPVPESERLRLVFHSAIKPYLEQGPRGSHLLAQPGRAATVFADLRLAVPEAAHPVVASLEGLCNQRRQLDRQLRLNFWLHNWLIIHLPLSVALMVFMVIHTFKALQYLYSR